MQDFKRYLPLLGRALIALPFIFSGFFKLVSYHATVGYIASVGLPLPQLGWLIAITVELGFATLLVLGYRVRPVAVLLALYCLATAIFFHRNFADQNQMINFLKNIMILGGLLQVVYFGAGPLSLDARATTRTVKGTLRGELT
ncbi:MAG: DoxX family protein [Steroidobacteraceae bacterium]